LILTNWKQIILPLGTLISIESDPIDSSRSVLLWELTDCVCTGIAAEILGSAKLLPDECFSTRT
jgi:hypothetical protein